MERGRRPCALAVQCCTVGCWLAGCRPAALSGVSHPTGDMFQWAVCICVVPVTQTRTDKTQTRENIWAGRLIPRSPFLSPQESCALASYSSSRSPVMSRSCGGTLLPWSVRLTESRPSTSDGSRTAWAWWRARGCTCSPTARCIYQRWRAEEETNQTKGSISASLRTNMVQSWARKPVLQSQVSVDSKLNLHFCMNHVGFF